MNKVTKASSSTSELVELTPTALSTAAVVKPIEDGSTPGGDLIIKCTTIVSGAVVLSAVSVVAVFEAPVDHD
jgi:hypothetical protein